MTPRICLSIGGTGLDDVHAGIDYAKSKGAGFVELRFDMLKETAVNGGLNAPGADIIEKVKKIISYAKDNGIKIIATNRESGVGSGVNNIRRGIFSEFNRQRVLNIRETAKTAETTESGKNKADGEDLGSSGYVGSDDCNGNGGGENCGLPPRINFLKSIIEAGADICDIELDILDRRAIKSFIDFAHGKNSEVILSVHDFSGQVDLLDATGFYIESRYLGADYFKLADTVISESDIPGILEKNARLHSIKMTDAGSFPEFIVFGMGEKGKMTRVFSLFYGSYLAYCASPDGITAPGQAGIDDFNEMMKCVPIRFLRYASNDKP